MARVDEEAQTASRAHDAAGVADGEHLRLACKCGTTPSTRCAIARGAYRASSSNG